MPDVLLAVITGVPLTLAVTVVAMALGTVLALPLLGLSLSPFAPLRGLSRAIIDLIRGVPIVVWLFILYFGLDFGDFKLSSFGAAVLGLGIISAAYLSEVFRGAVGSVNVGQFEASRALGMTDFDTWKSIVAPQAWRVAIPGYTTYGIGLLKDSSIASTIGVAEIVFLSNNYARSGGDGLTVFALAGLVYVLISIPVGLLSRVADEKLSAVVAK
ncbi:amino acid ABC transporter permease [Brevibacterium litoralis]|uniref:amino acid ABC transporter permease n=1 Tax=Brevibacterium litoralis TaxID=3138935 RepID=UPI0032EC9829